MILRSTPSKSQTKQPVRLFMGRVDIAVDGAGLAQGQPGLPDAPLTVQELIRLYVIQVIALPSTQANAHCSATDLTLDVVVERFQLGWQPDSSIDRFYLPMFQRPFVRISAELKEFTSNRPVASVAAQAKMPWTSYVRTLSQTVNWRFWQPAFTADDMEVLVTRACVDLLRQLKSYT